MSRIGAIKALGALATVREPKGDLFLSYATWRALRIEAGCEDPGDAPDGFSDSSIVVVSARDGVAYFMGDATAP